MLEVTIDSVRVSLTNQQRVVILKDIHAERYLTIWIGPYEAEAITIALQEVEVARPQTHDLLKNVITGLASHLIRVEIHTLKDDVFFGNLVLGKEDKEISVDSRPSDALALAIRCHVPILVASEVMEAAGIIPEMDIQEKGIPTEMESGEGDQEVENPQRLSVFEDFIQNLNMDDLKNPPDPDQDPDEPPPEESDR